MKYKGYTAVIEADEESGLLFGHVVGLRDGITFQGETIPALRKSFKESVDCYLEFCASRNEPPEKPFSGKFLIRITTALHRKLVEESLARGVSLNTLIERTLAAKFEEAGEVGPRETRDTAKVRTKAKPKVASKAATSSAASIRGGRGVELD